MKDEEIIVDEIYDHYIFGKIKILANITEEWEYFKNQRISTWKAQQYSPYRIVLCFNSKYFTKKL